MAIILTPAQTFTVTTTARLPVSGAGIGLVVYVITSTITGTWTFLMQYVAPDGTAISTHTVTAGITTATATNIVLVSPFTTATATPIPNQVVATESVAGTTTAQFLMSWSN